MITVHLQPLGEEFGHNNFLQSVITIIKEITAIIKQTPIFPKCEEVAVPF